jgi:hypothetical protein
MIFIEPLESRIAPAVFAVYTDADGDEVKVTTSKGTQAELDAAMGLITEGTGQRLDVLNLTAAAFAGSDVTIVATPKTPQSDGFANINRINATGRDLGKVTVDGDLGEIDAGDADQATPAIKSLLAYSMGTASASLGISNLEGVVKTFTIKRLLAGNSALLLNHPNLQSGAIKIGNLLGGAVPDSGSVKITGGVKSITIVGGIYGGGAENAGAILVDGAVSLLKVGREIVGGSGERSGSILADAIGQLTIGGDLIAGSANFTGLIAATEGGIGKVVLGGSMIGAKVPNGLAGIVAAGDIGSATIAGSMLDGGGGSGIVAAGFQLDALTLNSSGSLKAFTLKGGIIGSAPALIGAGKNIGKATFGRAALATSSATTIIAGVGIGALDFRGDVGGVRIVANGDATTLAIGSVRFGGDANSVQIGLGAGIVGTAFADPKVGSIKVTGDLNFSLINVGTLVSTGAKLVSLQVGGRMQGSSVVAHEIGLAKVGGLKVGLTTGGGNDNGLAFGAGNLFDEVA